MLDNNCTMDKHKNNNNRTSFTTYSCFDVLNGRGQGVQRHPGNINYRKLVFVNKGLYDNCPENDKIKISRGIVSAVRHIGGRFLKFDKNKNKYYEISDLEARKKTSQALRDAHSGKVCEMSLSMASINSAATISIGSPSAMKSLPEEAYFGYSVQVLDVLFNSNNDNGLEDSFDNLSPEEVTSLTQNGVYAPHLSANFSLGQVPSAAEIEPSVPRFTSSNTNPHTSINPFPPPQDTATITTATTETTDQSLDAAFEPNECELAVPPPPKERKSTYLRDQLMERISFGSNNNRNSLSSRRSTISISEFANQFFGATPDEEERCSMSSVLTNEIRDLIRCSDASFRLVEEMDVDQLFSENEDDADDDEVSLSFSYHEDIDDCNELLDVDLAIMTVDVSLDDNKREPTIAREVSLEDEDIFALFEQGQPTNRRRRQCLIKRDDSMKLSTIYDDDDIRVGDWIEGHDDTINSQTVARFA